MKAGVPETHGGWRASVMGNVAAIKGFDVPQVPAAFATLWLQNSGSLTIAGAA